MKQFFKTKPAKIALIAAAVAAVLVAAFCFAPGARPQSAPPTELGETGLTSAAPAVSGTNLALALDEALAAALQQPGQHASVVTAQSVDAVLPNGGTMAAGAGGATAANASSANTQRTASAGAATTTAAAATKASTPGATTTTTTRPASSSSSTTTTTTTTARPASSSSTTTTTTTTQKKTAVTISIRCDTVLNNMEKLKPEKRSIIPANGVMMSTRSAAITPGESAFDVLQRETQAARIHLEFNRVPAYNSVYIKGIGNLYEFDCGDLSGWMYKVNGVFQRTGASSVALQDGDVLEFVYTCDLGQDVGGGRW